MTALLQYTSLCLPHILIKLSGSCFWGRDKKFGIINRAQQRSLHKIVSNSLCSRLPKFDVSIWFPILLGLGVFKLGGPWCMPHWIAMCFVRADTSSTELSAVLTLTSRPRLFLTTTTNCLIYQLHCFCSRRLNRGPYSFLCMYV